MANWDATMFAAIFGGVLGLKPAVRGLLVLVCAGGSVADSATTACDVHQGGWQFPSQRAAAACWEHPMCYSPAQRHASLSDAPADVPHATALVEERLTLDGEWVRLSKGELSWSYDVGRTS